MMFSMESRVRTVLFIRATLSRISLVILRPSDVRLQDITWQTQSKGILPG